MAQTDRFCTQYLINKKCTNGSSCKFRHASRDDVKLNEPLSDKSVFTKGCIVKSVNNFHLCTPEAIRHSTNTGCALFNTTQLTSFFSNLEDTAAPNKMDSDGPSTSNQTADTADNEHENSEGPSAAKEDDNRQRLIQSNFLNINAPEFVPGTRFNSTSNSEKRLCPYAERDGFCKYPKGECTYLHGDNCDLCGRPALHPYNDVLKKKHIQECIRRHERDMELAFAVARSKEKICGICFEVIMQKCKEEQRFGILPSCNHCFCLSCIRRWRQSKQFENKIIRSCPECRIASDFVCPSAYWVDTKEDKDKVIEKYKQALARKDCKYFRFGRGKCPFGNKCFYRHCLQNGKKVDVGPPPSTNNANHSEALNDYPTAVEIIQLLEALQDVYGDFDELIFEDSDSDSWSDE